MTKKKEQSAIDAIYEILDVLSNFEKRLDVIDSNVKLLNNKVIGYRENKGLWIYSEQGKAANSRCGR